VNATNKISLLPLPARRFSQPFSRSNALVGPRVYSTPQALLGLRPSKLNTDTIFSRHPRRNAPSPLPHPSWIPSTRWSVFPRTSTIEDYPYLRRHQRIAPRPLARTGFHHGFKPTLKLCSRSSASSIAFWFHPPDTMIALLAFPSSGPFTGYPGISLPLMRFSPL